MDFDPSQFLAMAMTEEQNTLYTVPEVQPHPSIQLTPPGMITVQGGLQMETDMHIPVPTFGMLSPVNDQQELTEPVEEDQGMYPLEPMCVVTPEPDNTTPTQLSPVENNNDPVAPTVRKKVIPTTYEETQFRKHFYNANYERVKLFRLHCTICDTHLGCAPWITERLMRTHKLLLVPVCRKCFDFYGDINFPMEEGSEIYCCWCGQGGQVYCCSFCPKVVCDKCVKRNFGEDKVKEIEENDNWRCFVCKPEDIWPHRVILWGLQRLTRLTRQKVSALSPDEKRNQLSKDLAHCCPKYSSCYYPIDLPPKKLMSKIPLCLVALSHQKAVAQQPGERIIPIIQNIMYNQLQRTNVNNGVQQNQLITRPLLQQPVGVQNRHILPKQLNNQQQLIFRGGSRPAPYPMNRPTVAQVNRGYINVRPPSVPAQRLPMAPEIIELDDDSPGKQQPLVNDINWLFRGIRELKESMAPIKSMLDDFEMIHNDLKTDFTKLSDFSDKLSFKMKITICKMAKINQNIIEAKEDAQEKFEAKKAALDCKVKSVVHEIQMGISNIPGIKNQKTPVRSRPEPVTSSTPLKCDDLQRPEQNTSVSSTADDDVDLPAALLCEAVLETDDIKGNTNIVKLQSTPVKKRSTLPKARYKSGPLSKRSKGKSHMLNISKSNVDVIDLSDDECSTFDSEYYCKKFNIKPCRVILQKCAVRSASSFESNK